MRPTERLRSLLHGGEPVVAVGAHDALSAKLIESAGFDAVWASGFGISAVRAVPDANVLTMTETLEVVKGMVETVSIPVLADCDSGYGNAINVMRTVREFSREGAAGICLEDNVFPKRCSFYEGVQRDLVPIEEHAEKIRAARQAKLDRDFVVIARTEAFIAGEGLEQALARAHAYADAGADAVLVHSKSTTFDELREFASRWRGTLPLVAVPTTFSKVTVPELAACGFRLVIFANQPLRGAIRAQRDVLATLRRTSCTASVDDQITPLSEVYDIVGVPELKQNEREYLVRDETPAAVIIAAGFEPELMPLTHDRPKGMLEIRGRTILGQQLRDLRACGVRDIVIVRGHQKHAIDFPGVRYYDNDSFQVTGELASLACAREALKGRFLFLYSDILFERAILEKALRSAADVSLVVDRAYGDQPAGDSVERRPDLVCTGGEWKPARRFVPSPDGAPIERIGKQLDPGRANGEFIGMAVFSAAGAAGFVSVLDAVASHRGPFHEAPSLERAAFTDIVQEMIDRGREVRSVDVYKGWMEVNTFEDYRRAWGRAADAVSEDDESDLSSR